ncbi:MAG TPA: S-layer homology domain-containing protein [Clostridia bacterium]|nr:S-layer homology domain-containing protein [Clostridia bacterium]
MKKFLGLVVTIVFLLSSFNQVFANDAGFENGIANEQEYREVVFITGEPIVFKGVLKVSKTVKGDTIKTTYRYDLTSERGDKLTRSLSFVTQQMKKPEYNQIISQTALSTYSENIKIGNNTYALDRNNGYVFLGSEVRSINPAVTYYAGNYSGVKLYRINGTKGTVKVSINDKTVGFTHKYGSAETHQIDYLIESSIGTNKEAKKWTGEAHVNVSFTDKSTIEYVENDPQYISFRGGYLLKQNSDNMMNYSYNLSKLDDNSNEIGRNIGNGSLKLEGVPLEKRLVVPNVKDINGTWGREDIKKLLAMEIFPNDSEYFGPKLPILRMNFTTAVAKAIGLEPEEPTKTTLYAGRNKVPAEISPFIDVSVSDPNYGYIKKASDVGLISGTAPNQFSPSKSLTRAEAAVIFIRALGLENLAPSGNFATGFLDDSLIPLWAKRSVYVARNIGLLSGDGYGRFNPSDYVTREEAAAMISRMLDFMMRDLTFDYVMRILNYH